MQTDKGQYLSELPTIAKGAGVNFAGTLISKILAFFFTLFIARALATGELAQYYLGLSVTNALFTLSVFGLNAGAIRFVSLFHGQRDTSRVKGTILSCLSIATPVSLLVGILLFLFANDIAVHIFHEPSFGNVLKLFSLSIPFLVIGRIFIATTHGFKLMHYRVITETGEIILRFIITLLLVFILGFGLNGLILSCVSSLILSAFLAYYFVVKLIATLKDKSRPVLEFRKLLRFSFPQAFSELFICSAIYADTLMLGYFRTSEEVGIYSIAFGLAIFGLMISESFRTIFAPIIADLHNKKKMKQLNDLFKVVTRWIFTLSLPPLLLFILFPKPILSIFGKEFTMASTCLMILSLGFLVSSAVGPANHMVLMTGRSGLSFINHIVVLTINVLLNYLLIPKYGIIGVAVSKAISTVFVDIIRLIETYYLMKIHPYNRSYWKPLLAGTISTLIIFLGHDMLQTYPNNIIGMSAFLCCYLFIIYMLKFNNEESYIIKEIGRKLYFLVGNGHPS